MSAVTTALEADRIIAFLANYCEHSKEIGYGDPFVVEDWQADFLREAYKPDPNDPGRRFYQRVFFCIPARNGKSSLAAGLTLWHLLGDPFAQSPVVLCAANSGAQANIVFGAAATFVKLSPALTKKLSVLPGNGTIRYRVQKKGQLGEIKRVNAEAGNLFGIDASTIVLDELHQVVDEMYDTLSTRLASRNSPFFLSLSTAGGNKQGILGRIYDEAHETWEVIKSTDGFFAARDEASRSLIWWYGASDSADISDPSVWTACNPASWMTEQKLAERFAESKSNMWSFQKYNLNQWAAGAGALLETGVWAGLRNDSIKIEPGDKVILGVDVAESRDHSAVAMIGPKKGDKKLRPVEALVIAPEDVPYMPTAVADYIRQLADTRGVVIEDIVFDPRFFGTEAQQLMGEGFNLTRFDWSGKKVADATENFRELAIDSRICHDGDPILASHIANTAMKTNAFGTTIDKLKSDRFKMDAAAALVMASWLVGPEKLAPVFFMLGD